MKKILLFLMFALFCIPWAANAQTTVTIGDGTSTDYYTPIGTYYNYSITEQLYTAEEIGMAGTISSISFYYAGTAAKDFPITVYMANVDAEDLSTGVSLADADVVFEGTYSVTETGWMTITLDTPFAYNGTSNLLIGINKGYVYWYSGGNWNHTTTEAVMARYSNNDNNAYDNSTVPGTTRTARPNIQLVITAGGGPVCEKPFFFATNDVTSTSCEVMWESSDAANIINLQYKAASESEWTEVNGLTGMTYTITDLVPGTVYNARVQVVCGEENLSGWKTLNFTTSCGAVTTFPWTETFESYASGDFVDPCWVNEHIEGAGTQLFKVYTYSNAGNATHQLTLPDMNIGTLTKLVLPEMTLPANYEFSIDIYRSSSTYNDSYPSEGIRVYASANGEIEGATELAFIPRHYEVSNDVIPAESATGWYTYELPIGMSGTCYIILSGESHYCTATYMDNLTVKAIPTCPRPTSLVVTANIVTAHEATITWTENGEATEWIVEFDTVATFTQPLFETVDDNPTYTFQGLEPETTYYVRVKAHCGPGDESEYSNEVHFTTSIACPAPTGLAVYPGNYSAAVNWNGTSESYNVSYRTAAYAEGIVEEFNSYGVPSGWTRHTGLVDSVIAGTHQLSTTTSGWSSNSYALGQYNMKLNIYGTSCRSWLVTPEFNLSQNLSFDLALTDYNNADPIENDTLQA
ncbi:MAG: fibronectin type III domain-containing protein, partial [Bacteroidales bacterium]|nr:fibronectin type III domain-containing protein [Bacteroidales bacterium]